MLSNKLSNKFILGVLTSTALFTISPAHAFFDVEKAPQKTQDKKTQDKKVNAKHVGALPPLNQAEKNKLLAQFRKEMRANTPSKLPANQKYWQLKSGMSLEKNLKVWGKKANWSVVWNTKGVDYMVTHGVTLNGNFINALEKVLLAYRDAEYPLSANIYKMDRVIEIVQHEGYKNMIGQMGQKK